MLNEVSHAVVACCRPDFNSRRLSRHGCHRAGTRTSVPQLRLHPRDRPPQSRCPVSAAQGELDAIASRLEQAFPKSNEGRGVNVFRYRRWRSARSARRCSCSERRPVRAARMGCANVGNLVLAKGTPGSGSSRCAVRSVQDEGVWCGSC